jgi:predicted DCC family thiol-disulfide oxidoreductase YuxK
MNPRTALRDGYLRIDARSLGLFRLAMGVVLVGDLFRRARWLKELYTNDGVLPNHNHLFILGEGARVWSVLHAFTTVGEVQTAFAFILFFYACFLAGWHTRAFHVVALICLVSLGARNVLLSNAGDHLAVALLGFTAFLPLGSRFSLDSLGASLAARDEKGPPALNDPRRPAPSAVDAARTPGWTPTSLAAFATLAQIASVYLVMGLVQRRAGVWRDGSALYYALNVERWISGAGAAARGVLGAGALSAWTRAFHLSELAIPLLVFAPFAWRLTRGVAVGLVLFTGLTLGIFFSFGLFGWTLAASAALLVPGATWDRFEQHRVARRARTVIYDVDCGFCLWVCRVLRRLDLRQNLTFQGNDDLAGLNVRDATGSVHRAELPGAVTEELVASSVVVVGPGGEVHTRAHAAAQIVQALPLGGCVAWAMTLPGVVDLLHHAYDFVAARRQRISLAMGKAACGIDTPREAAEELPPPDPPRPPPSTRLRRGVVALARELTVAVVFAAALAETTHANALRWTLPQPSWLAAVAAWPRMLARWDVLAAPPPWDEVMVVDAQTRAGKGLDLLTGKPPDLDPGAMRGTGLGQLWNDYLDRIHQREWADYQRAFRDYLNRGGPFWEPKSEDDQIAGYDGLWIKQPIPPPGQPRATGLAGHDRFMVQAKGGLLTDKAFGPRILPVLRPQITGSAGGTPQTSGPAGGPPQTPGPR